MECLTIISDSSSYNTERTSSSESSAESKGTDENLSYRRLKLNEFLTVSRMKKKENVRLYKLNSKERDRYLKFYKHIAPEIIWGRSPLSPASHIY
jgi:hypothetical protein